MCNCLSSCAFKPHDLFFSITSNRNVNCWKRKKNPFISNKGYCPFLSGGKKTEQNIKKQRNNDDEDKDDKDDEDDKKQEKEMKENNENTEDEKRKIKNKI